MIQIIVEALKKAFFFSPASSFRWSSGKSMFSVSPLFSLAHFPGAFLPFYLRNRSRKFPVHFRLFTGQMFNFLF
jgi:hypothetical protein